MAKSFTSLYKGDYYTIDEYKHLADMLGGNLLALVINGSIIRGLKPSRIKLDINGFFISFVYNLIYHTSLSDIPLHINTDSPIFRAICQWRLDINK